MAYSEAFDFGLKVTENFAITHGYISPCHGKIFGHL